MGKLVAYSGFSASNYLQQPYNSDLDFGTGDFCVMAWIKQNGGVSQTAIMRKTLGSNSDGGYGLDFNGDGTLRFHTRSSSANTDVSSTSALNNNVWFHAVGVRMGGVSYLYINGELNASISGTVRDLTNTTGTLEIGRDPYTGSYALTDGSIALARISATAPTAEQIAKIYEDEKHLFTEGAQATLYGSSDAVTALAYDDTTDLLHVGTSAGRSDFSGLRRVSNTTTGVTTAISASNEMIVEQ